MKLYYPHKPYYTTQSWGNPNESYSSHFGNPTFKRHNGIDSVNGKTNWDGTIKTEFLVYCPVEGFYVESVTNEPNGGGNQVSLVSNKRLVIGGKECYVRLFLCHAKKILVKPGDQLELGELIMISDSTGFSTGLHLHVGMYRLDPKNMQKMDVNEATGSYDPAMFWTGEYAVDKASVSTLIKSGTRYYKYLLGL